MAAAADVGGGHVPADMGAGRVHFPEHQVTQHDSEIVIREGGDHKIDVYLGFLQVKHNYEVTFSIKDTLHEDLTSDPLQNLHVKVIQVRPSENGEGHDLVISYHTHKEKLMNETVQLCDSTDPAKNITLVLHARVLGKGKGTPALKTGIHCTGVDADYDSEQSDWQGFD